MRSRWASKLSRHTYCFSSQQYPQVCCELSRLPSSSVIGIVSVPESRNQYGDPADSSESREVSCLL